MFNRMKTVVTFTAGAVAGLMLAACLTVQGSHPGVFGGEALILPLMGLLLYVGYEAGRLAALAQAEQRRRRTRKGGNVDGVYNQHTAGDICDPRRTCHRGTAVWMGTEGHQLDVLGMGKDDPKARWLGDLV